MEAAARGLEPLKVPQVPKSSFESLQKRPARRLRWLREKLCGPARRVLLGAAPVRAGAVVRQQ